MNLRAVLWTIFHPRLSVKRYEEALDCLQEAGRLQCPRSLYMTRCAYCRLEITGQERDAPAATINDGAHAIHQACLTRMICGSVGHQRKECSCYGGEGTGDPDDADTREAALAAWDEFNANRKERKPIRRDLNN